MELRSLFALAILIQPAHYYVLGKIGISDLFIAQGEKDNAVLSYVQALRAYWTAYYHLRRVTLYDFVAKQELADVPESRP